MSYCRRHPGISLLFSFCALAFQFPLAVMRADETPAPSANPAAQSAVAISTPTRPHPAVHSVGIHDWWGENRRQPAIYAQRGDEIWVDIYNLEGWKRDLEKQKKLPDQNDIKDLVLYLDHRPLTGVPPIYWHEVSAWTEQSKDGKEPSVEYKITTVGFPLIRNDTSKPAWSHLLSQPVLNRRVVVSVGFNNGEEIDSFLKPDAKGIKELDQQFFLTVIPNIRTAIGLVVILGALIAFLALARHTHIIRDATAPRRPDGIRPYSLARAQMAFWFFLVIASYFGNTPTVDVTRPHLEVVEELGKLRTETLKELEALQKARAQISSADKQQLEENERQQDELRERLANIRWQAAYFAWPTWKGVMYDLLAENNLISFHRFQIFVWTLVLGIMFVANVYTELAMPQFSATLLGLLGISAGTYVGFKLPEAKPPPVA